MAVITQNTRITHKHATYNEWLNSDIIPFKGELIVYDVDPDNAGSPVGVKFGDGVSRPDSLLLYKPSKFFIVSLRTDWTDNGGYYTQEITVNGITESDNPNISPVYTGSLTTDANITIAWENVYRIKTGNNKITVYSYVPFKHTFSINIYC